LAHTQQRSHQDRLSSGFASLWPSLLAWLSGLFGVKMDAQILIDKARLSVGGIEHQSTRLVQRIGYLEQTIREICALFSDAEEIMYQQKELIEQMKKANSASL
jgi:hypothetical protein